MRELKTSVVLVTPTMALAWLLKNGIAPGQPNRKLRQTRVEHLAGMMRRGEWMLTHQGIAFTDDMWLIDGQHRLHAVVLSGCSVWMTVTIGVDQAAFDVIDIGGAPRSVADVLRATTIDSAVATLAYRIVAKEKVNRIISTAQLRPYLAVFSPLVEELTRDGGTSGTKRLVNAHIRLAAILAAEVVEGYDYVRPLYRSLIKRDYANLPSVAISFIRRIDADDLQRSNHNPEMLVHARTVFTRRAAGNTKLQLKDIEHRLDLLRAEITQVFARRGVSAGTPS